MTRRSLQSMPSGLSSSLASRVWGEQPEAGRLPSQSRRYTDGMEKMIPNEPSGSPGRGFEEAVCDRSEWPVWVGRIGDPQPRADFSHLTPSERVELCWEVTKQAWSLTGATLDESTFRRDSESVSRRGR